MLRWLIQVLLGSLFWAAAARSEENPRAQSGMLDLRAWDFEQREGLSLGGDWLFLPKQLVEGEEALQRLSHSRPQAMPGPVNSEGVYAAQTDVRYGTYLLRVQLDAHQALFGMRLWLVMGAWRLFVYNPETRQSTLLAENGTIASTLEETRVAIKDRLVPVPLAQTGKQELWFILQISSHTIAPGTFAAPRFGPYEAMEDEEVSRQIERALLMGAFATIALYCFALFGQRPSDRANLWAALLACALGIRYMSTEWLVYRWTEGAPGLEALNLVIMNTTSHLCILLVSLFLYSLYPRRGLLWIVWSNLTFQGCMVLGFLVFGVDRMVIWGGFLMSASLLVYIPSLLIALIYLLYRRAQDVRWIVAGYLALGLAAFNDFFMFYYGLESVYMLHYAVVAITFWQSLLTGRRFARTYRKNEELLQEISEKEQARTLFFHNTSHELRTPLNGIIGFLQLLALGRFGEQTIQAREQLHKCSRLAESLKNQVNTILDLAKSKRGTLSLNRSRISLKQLTREVYDLAEGLQLKSAQNSFDLLSSWSDEDDTFIGDRDKIATILRNLLGNAFKFVDPKRPNTVRLVMERRDSQLYFEVHDTGIGIPHDQVNRIFEEFAQVAGDARRVYEGTGLGLTMVRDLVQLMGGKIEVTSELGRGSLFIVKIPEQSEVDLLVAADDEAPAPTDVSIVPPRVTRAWAIQADSGDQEKPLILVVDDHEINCEVMQHLLEAEGYRVSTAYGGQEALDKARWERPDLMLLDMMMPQVSGEDVMRQLRADRRLEGIPVILLTARAGDDDRVHGLSLGADDYLAKPLHHEELLFRVRNLLQRLELSKRLAIAEEREKMAQLGDMLAELSHELKNMFQLTASHGAIEASILGTILRRLPIFPADWDGDLSDLGRERFTEGASSSESIYFDPEAGPTLRALHMRVADLPIDEPRRRQLWQAVLQLNPEDQEYCENVLRLIKTYQLLEWQLRHASELVLSMLGYSRAESDTTLCEWRRTWAMVSQLLKPRLVRGQICLRDEGAQMDTQLPMSAQQLTQVLLNLFGNAIDAVSSTSREERWIEVGVEMTTREFVLKIRNGGPPIAAAVASRMFDRGFSTKGKQGSGWGLSISRRLLEKAEGTLELDTQESHTCFVLRLPRTN